MAKQAVQPDRARKRALRVNCGVVRQKNEEARQKGCGHIEEYGWHCLHIAPRTGGQGAHFTYTIGLVASYQHPELMIFGLGREKAHGILCGALGMMIRRYKDDDWPRLRVIHDLARMDELRGANLVEAFLPLEVAAEKEGLFGYDILVAEEDGVPFGFVAYSQNELSWLYVDPNRYRQGIASLLARAAIDERPEGLSTEILQGNTAALCFYKSIGFLESGMANGWMPGNEQYAVVVHRLEYKHAAQQGAQDRRAEDSARLG
jgi:GNAT superfamily N-acetyltransferase